MRFTVIWKTSAEEDLARFWLEASSIERLRIRSACRELDKALALGPSYIGKSRSGEIRIVVCRPLAVTIEVSEPDRTINVLSVHQLR